MLPGESNSPGFKKAGSIMDGKGVDSTKSVGITAVVDDVTGVGGGGTLPEAPVLVVLAAMAPNQLANGLEVLLVAVVVASSPSGVGNADADGA